MKMSNKISFSHAYNSQLSSEEQKLGCIASIWHTALLCYTVPLNFCASFCQIFFEIHLQLSHSLFQPFPSNSIIKFPESQMIPNLPEL